MLSDEQKAVLHYAIDNGFETIEVFNKDINAWICCYWSSFGALVDGEINTRIKQLPDSIDWTHVSTDIYCMARDEDGDCYLYFDMPDINKTAWAAQSGHSFMLSSFFASYKRGTTDWKESLVLNPHYKDKK